MPNLASETGAFGRDIRSVPNVVTLSRIVLIVAAAAAFLLYDRLVGLVLGIIAGWTDYLDGYLARRMNLVSRLGEILDQFSDLVMEAMCLLVTAVIDDGISPGFLMAYLMREFWVTSIRRFMAEKRINIASTIFGKLKTNFLLWSMVPLAVSISGKVPQVAPYDRWLALFGLSMGLFWGYLSAWQYTRQFMAGYDRAVADEPRSHPGV